MCEVSVFMVGHDLTNKHEITSIICIILSIYTFLIHYLIFCKKFSELNRFHYLQKVLMQKVDVYLQIKISILIIPTIVSTKMTEYCSLNCSDNYHKKVYIISKYDLKVKIP